MPGKKTKLKLPRIRSRAHERRTRLQISFPGHSLTKQSFKDECDINKIMAQYVKTGTIQHVKLHAPEYGFASSLDFGESIRVVTKAQEMFDDLPSGLRTRFHNNPAEFLEFVQDASNHDEMRTMGLLAPDPSPTPEAVKPAPEATQASKTSTKDDSPVKT